MVRKDLEHTRNLDQAKADTDVLICFAMWGIGSRRAWGSTLLDILELPVSKMYGLMEDDQ